MFNHTTRLIAELIVLLVLALLVCKIIGYFFRQEKLKLAAKTKNILVTGCDTGFGNLLTKRMDKKGFCVFTGCLTEEGVTSLRECCSRRAKPFLLDVTKEDSIMNAVNFVQSSTIVGGLWALINNAGVSGPHADVTWCSKKDYDDVLNVNFHGVRNMCEAFLPMLKQSRGRIVNMASAMGRITLSHRAPYCVSKHAIEVFSDALRREVCHLGISVHIIEPGLFKTHLADFDSLQASYMSKWNRLPDYVKLQYGDTYPQKRLNAFRNHVKKASSEVDLVVDAYEHAMLAVRPRTRYAVGWRAKFLYVPLSVLPDWIGDWYFAVTRPGGM